MIKPFCMSRLSKVRQKHWQSCHSFPTSEQARWRLSPFDKQKGATVVSVLMVIGVMSILAGVLSRFTGNLLKSQRHVEISGDLAAIRSMVQNTMSCSATIAANSLNIASCSSGSLVPVLDISGNQLITAVNASPTKIGEWTLRARCFNTGTTSPGIHIEVARPNPALTSSPLTDNVATHFFSDPSTNVRYDWSGSNAAMSIFSPATGAQQMCWSQFTTFTCPATASAMSGGIGPIGSADPPVGAQVNPAQWNTPLSGISGVLINTNALGKRHCRYAAPLVHGGGQPTALPVSVAKAGPASWQFVLYGTGGPATYGPVPFANPTGLGVAQVDHYGNNISCPAGWFGTTGAGACDATANLEYESGGFTTSSFMSFYGSPGQWHWSLQCGSYFQPGVTAEAIAGGVTVDCQEY